MTPFTQPAKLQVLITGAAGIIGMCLRAHWRGRYGLLRLADIAEQEPAGAGEEVRTFDIRDIDSVERCMQGMDCVVHLAGVPVEDSWEKVLPLNIEGCYNVFEAARRRACGVSFSPARTMLSDFTGARGSLTIPCNRGPIPATAFRKCSAKQSAACTPTNTACRWRACASVHFANPIGRSSRASC